MELNKLKEYLQNYLDTVAIPRFNQEVNDDGITSFVVNDILKGSYQPQILHVFLESVPWVNRPQTSTKARLRILERDIHDFIKMFAVKNPVKVHLNKKPVLKSGKSYDTNI